MRMAVPMELKPKWLILARAFTWTFVASTIVALIALIQNKWFGAGDLNGFLICTGIFSAIVAGVGLLLFHLVAPLSIWLRYAAGTIVGLALGFLFTLANRLLLGDWFGAWSIPVFTCWLGGGILGVAAAVGTRRGIGARLLATEMVTFLLLLLAVSSGLPLLARTVTHDQHFTFISARWYPGDSPLVLEDPRGILLPQDRGLLNRAAVRGRIVVWGELASNRVEFPKARMIVLFSEPITERVKLAQPYASDVLYEQEGRVFQAIPERCAPAGSCG
jgi:hypothetical protein